MLFLFYKILVEDGIFLSKYSVIEKTDMVPMKYDP